MNVRLSCSESLRRVLASSVFWSQLVPVVRLTGYFLVLLVGLRKLPPEELGLWYVLMTIASLGGTIELGFHHTIARFAAYFMAGQGEVSAIGIGRPANASASPRFDRLAGLMKSARPLYTAFAWSAGFISLVLGGAWLLFSNPPKLTEPVHYATFLIVACGTAYNLAHLYWYATLNGVNRVRLYQQLTVLGLGANYAVALTGLALGAGILSLAVGFVLMFFVQRFGARRAIKQMIPPADTINPPPVHLRELWPMTWRLGMVALASYLTLPITTLICAKTVGLQAAGSYGLSLQVALIIAAFSSSWFTVKVPQLFQWQAQLRLADIRRVGRRMLLSILTYAFLATLVWCLGPAILALMGSQTSLLPPSLLVLLLALTGCEMTLGMHVAALQSGNRAPHMIPAVITALVALAASIWAGSVWGVAGILTAQLVASGICLYWLVPWLFWRSLRTEP